MKNITKYFKGYKSAERYMLSLMDKYESVELISAPLFDNAGYYTFRCQ